MNSRIFTAVSLGMILLSLALAFVGYFALALIVLCTIALCGIWLAFVAWRS